MVESEVSFTSCVCDMLRYEKDGPLYGQATRERIAPVRQVFSKVSNAVAF